MKNLRAFKQFFERVRDYVSNASRNGHFGIWLLNQLPSPDEKIAGTEFMVQDQGSDGLFEVHVNYYGQILIGRVSKILKCGNFLFLDVRTDSQGFRELKFPFSHLAQARFECENSSTLILVIEKSVLSTNLKIRKGSPDDQSANTAKRELRA
ncbi:hypothetical protein KKF61_03285 [Patescibacteria group bacterium]|nr:hypothetical protein [Patescibacteria group bacterium]MBU0963742.1 hypothetical protein [Patescibacteria group bacterium]